MAGSRIIWTWSPALNWAKYLVSEILPFWRLPFIKRWRVRLRGALRLRVILRRSSLRFKKVIVRDRLSWLSTICIETFIKRPRFIFIVGNDDLNQGDYREL